MLRVSRPNKTNQFIVSNEQIRNDIDKLIQTLKVINLIELN